MDDPVTIADLKVNKTVIQRINDKYKDVDWDILSEENVKSSSNDFNRNNDWIVGTITKSKIYTNFY